MRGSIRSRSSGSREVKYEAGPDPKTGQRRTRYITVKGTKREAQRRLVELLHQVDIGTHCDLSKLTIADYLEQVDGLDPTVVSPPAISENTLKPDVFGVENPPLSSTFDISPAEPGGWSRVKPPGGAELTNGPFL
jgi:hypothetical protein